MFQNLIHSLYEFHFDIELLRDLPLCEAVQRALREFEIVGVQTTIPFHQEALDNAFFRRGEVYINFIQRRMDLTALRA